MRGIITITILLFVALQCRGQLTIEAYKDSVRRNYGIEQGGGRPQSMRQSAAYNWLYLADIVGTKPSKGYVDSAVAAASGGGLSEDDVYNLIDTRFINNSGTPVEVDPQGATAGNFLVYNGHTWVPYAIQTGNITLSSGTATQGQIVCTAASYIGLMLINPSGTLGVQYRVTASNNTFTVYSVGNTGVVQTSDASTLRYVIIN